MVKILIWHNVELYTLHYLKVLIIKIKSGFFHTIRFWGSFKGPGKKDRKLAKNGLKSEEIQIYISPKSIVSS